MGDKHVLAKELFNTFRSLQYRNYRLYFIGQLLSLSGTWMQQVALSWLVYRMTHSTYLLGVVEGASLLPVMLLGLLGGWVADHSRKKDVLIVCQLVAMIQALVLALLTFNNQIEVWHCIALALLLGTVNAFEIPTRQSFLPQLIDRKDLVNAISLNSSIFNGARIIGPAIAGLAIPFFGEAACFFLNAASYLSTLIAYILIKDNNGNGQADAAEKKAIADGVKFILNSPTIVRLIFLGGVISLCGMNYNVLMPVFASDILHGDVRTLAMLRAGAGLGAFSAALLLASRGKGEFLKVNLGFASILFGMSLFAFSLSSQYWLCQIIIVFVGFFLTSQLSGGHSLVQLAVKDDLRGRVLGIYLIVMMGFSPVGSLIIGWSAAHYGAPVVVSACACICMVAGLVYTLWTRRDKSSSEDY
ncbi:MAG: MFS transporter [Candidatus Melainabacteria bacterium]|nr:MFS transporter [Candidatus Melainabacteria bacterium]